MKLSSPVDDEEPSVHITPLVDVIFLILVAYIEATVFLTRGVGVPIDLPRAATSVPAAAETLSLAITAEGEIFLDQRPLAIDELRETLAARRAAEPDLVLHVFADRSAPVDPLVRVLDLSRELGVRGVTLATEDRSVVPREEEFDVVQNSDYYGSTKFIIETIGKSNSMKREKSLPFIMSFLN